MGWGEPRGASAVLRDAAKQAARDEIQRMGVQVSDYVVGRIVEVTAAVLNGVAVVAAMQEFIDVDSWEVD